MASLAQIRRLLSLLELLRSERPHSAQALADTLSISRRTLFRDLKVLEKFGFVAAYDERAGRYNVRSVQPSGSEGGLPSDELHALLLLGQKLEGIETADEDTPGGLLEELVELRADGSGSPGQNTIGPIVLSSLRQSRQLTLDVHDDTAGRETITLQPYKLLSSFGFWYLAGADVNAGRTRIVPLRLIERATETETSFTLPGRDERNLAIEAAWQTDIEAGPGTDVVVRFQATIARDVAARQWFRKQDLIWLEDGELELRAYTSRIDPLVGWVLSYGADARVIAPDTLRDRVADEVRRLCEQSMTCATSY